MKSPLESNEKIGTILESLLEHKASISLEYADALYRAVIESEPSIVLEIGMAFGLSSLAILAALDEIGGDGKLISIDPFQSTQWLGKGVAAVQQAGLGDRHKLIEKFDHVALPELLESGLQLDFGYIDGWHTFDYTLLDFWYIDKMLRVGGMVAFNDCNLPAVTHVISFVLSHRKYSEINIGIPIRFADYNPKREIGRLIRGKRRVEYYRQAQDRYFRKTANWEPDWDFYSKF